MGKGDVIGIKTYEAMETRYKNTISDLCILLTIIKDKGVNIGNFKEMLDDWSNITFEDYNNYREENGYEIQTDEMRDKQPLAEYEFIVIKSWLQQK